MDRRLIAAALLAVLTILGGMDFLEDTGLIRYSTSEMDKSLEDVLDNYGEAVRSDDRISSVNLNPRATYCGSISQHLVISNPTYEYRRKRNLDFAESACNPLKYSSILLV